MFCLESFELWQNDESLNSEYVGDSEYSDSNVGGHKYDLRNSVGLTYHHLSSSLKITPAKDFPSNKVSVLAATFNGK